jgi:hypothetical protein
MTTEQLSTGEREAHWSVGGSFLEALASRDFDKLATTLAPSVRFRAMLPPGPREWQGSGAVTDAFRSWFGDADEFQLVDATVSDVGHRLHLSWHIQLCPAPFGIGDGSHRIEQQAFVDATETIQAIDLLCSGFQPDIQMSRSDAPV